MEIRFDSHGRATEARTTRFAGLQETVEAYAPDEVIPALERIDRATRAGLHAAGFIAYEAAPAMDPALVTHAADAATPLLLFGLFERRIDTPLSSDLEPSPPSAYTQGDAGEHPSITRSEYDAAIARVLDYIGAGDSYQVNFSFRLRGSYTG